MNQQQITDLQNQIVTREIKFRVWDTKHDMFGRGDKAFTYTLEQAMSDKRFAVIQFTGLKDKSGKEIYEGDIVNAVAKSIYEDASCTSYISRDASDTAWCVISPGNAHGLHLLWGGWDSIEVIGNVFENPELLTKSNE